jgi:SagB-type dehydrogenase family enzyme
MRNDDITTALEYHESTKHSEISLQLSRHYLDWDNKPSVFKIYTKLPSIPLPQDFPQPTLDALTSVSSIMPTVKSVTTLDTRSLSEILFFSDGITRKMKYPYGTYFMRAASATGALYPIELYVVCQDMADSGNGGLDAGVYHFCPGDFSLTKLRAGDYRVELAAATATKIAQEEDNDSNKHNIITTSPATIIFTSIAWRNAWKYQSRSYRHWYWDSGVIAANLLATTVSIGMPTALIMGFVDDAVNSLLRLDDKQEAAIAMAVLGIGLSKSSSSSSSAPVLSAEEKDYGGQISPKAKEEKEERKTRGESTSSGNIPEVLPISKMEKVINYPEIWKVHSASYLSNIDELRNWINKINTSKIISKKQGLGNNGGGGSSSRDVELLHSQPLGVKEEGSSLSSTTSSQATLGQTILLRGSSRKFARKPISFQILSNILQSSTRGVPLDFLKGSKESWEQYVKSNKKKGNSIVDIYLIANDISGLVKGGAYYFNRKSDSLEQLERNASRTMSGYLCLGQQLFSDASAVFFLMTNLQEVLKTLGNRGYRASQFEAGIIAGKIYLSAYAQGVGASGSTFFDDAVTEFFSPHAREKNTMIVVGVGIPGYTARPGKILAGPLTRIQLINERHNNNN